MLHYIAIAFLFSAAALGFTEKAVRLLPSSAAAAPVTRLDDFMANVGFAREKLDPFIVNGKRFGGIYRSKDCNGQLFMVLLSQTGDNLPLLRSITVSAASPIRYYVEGRVYGEFPRYIFWLQRQLREFQSVFQTPSTPRFDVALGVLEGGNCNMMEAVPWQAFWRN